MKATLFLRVINVVITIHGNYLSYGIYVSHGFYVSQAIHACNASYDSWVQYTLHAYCIGKNVQFVLYGTGLYRTL